MLGLSTVDVPDLSEGRERARKARPAQRVAWPAPCGEPCVMSQKSIEIVIGRLATDETLRARFLADPAGTLRSLRETGLVLNSVEVEALLEMPKETWVALAAAIHPRLQKIAWSEDVSEP
jgi:hypothetical protein